MQERVHRQNHSPFHPHFTLSKCRFTFLFGKSCKVSRVCTLSRVQVYTIQKSMQKKSCIEAHTALLKLIPEVLEAIHLLYPYRMKKPRTVSPNMPFTATSNYSLKAARWERWTCKRDVVLLGLVTPVFQKAEALYKCVVSRTKKHIGSSPHEMKGKTHTGSSDALNFICLKADRHS